MEGEHDYLVGFSQEDCVSILHFFQLNFQFTKHVSYFETYPEVVKHDILLVLLDDNDICIRYRKVNPTESSEEYF